ncbi:hypothetical protein ULMA_17310 [Patiriisocius marinus]|jgi:hypothetical protein|uniref:Uncharacterized protein n=2 Tax=Patiriisocius marinus TaxID=1397112 RepID=A0A5J4J1B9_9FLAO|nr:hypothetical protein ULMA_17310 [Patiriisocius marinus]
MIYFNNQLMPNDTSTKLFMVTNTKPFERYEDHEAALYIQLHQLVEHAFAKGENPIALIEDYLELVYTEGKSVGEIADFLANTDKMQLALWTLKESWDKLDETAPQDSLLYGSGMGKEEAIQLYSEITLRTYLEALAQHKNE